MKELLKKEMGLTASPLTYWFLLFSAMAMIPGYPILVSAFFICLGIFYTFQFAREYNDILFTVLLPVKKGDIVRGKYRFVLLVQLAGILLSAVFTAVSMAVMGGLDAFQDNAMMNANPAYLGYMLGIFALFDLVFLPGYFKTAYYVGKPFVLFTVSAFFLIALGETLHHIPGLEILNVQTLEGLFPQALVLGAGILLFVLGFAVSQRISLNRFEKLDL